MRGLNILIVGAALAISASVAAVRAEGPPVSGDDWRARLGIAPDEARQFKTYGVVASRPLSDNGVLVPWLRENASRLHPIFAFELSRRLFAEDRDAALEWFVMGQLRVYYDARRCTDPTAGDSFAMALMIRRLAPEVAAYSTEHQRDDLAAWRRAQARSDLFTYDSSPAWICGHGLAAYGKALGVEQPEAKGALKPPAEWPAIERKLRDELPQIIAAKEQSIAESEAAEAAAAERPHVVPEAVAAGSLDDKVRAIGAEARASLDAIRDGSWAHLRPWQLLNLAEAQIDAADANGARHARRGVGSLLARSGSA